MKCAYYQRQKQDRMTTEDRKRLSEVVNDFMQKSMVAGVDKALEMMQEENEKKEEETKC